jgi:hypothetical protein
MLWKSAGKIYSAITRHNVHSAYQAIIHEGNENGVLHL